MSCARLLTICLLIQIYFFFHDAAGTGQSSEGGGGFVCLRSIFFIPLLNPLRVGIDSPRDLIRIICVKIPESCQESFAKTLEIYVSPFYHICQ